MNRLAPVKQPDDRVARLLERAAAEVRPDPLYRRRLRADLVNRHVALREGLITEPRPQREMGRLGRAVLYASLATALSVSAVGAAAQDAVPGDLLYSMKLQLEDIRLRIASPALRHDLLAQALDERLEEVEQLARRGEWQRAAGAAIAAEAAEDRLSTDGMAIGRQDADEMQRHVVVLTDLLADAPPSARNGLERALDAATFGPARGASQDPGSTSNGSHADDEDPQ
ncbi:MAG: DUF5667 domain-containing protein [Chloroflexota bacterium]|nr:DUF5667 domain-containing protein [Chloroflexota bacterium]